MVANSSIAKGRFCKISGELAAWAGYIFIFISAFREETKQENRVDDEGYANRILSIMHFSRPWEASVGQLRKGSSTFSFFNFGRILQLFPFLGKEKLVAPLIAIGFSAGKKPN